MKYRNAFITIVLSLFAFSVQAEEETCVENIHVIGHKVRVAFVAGNIQDYIKSTPLAFTPLPLNGTHCEMPPARFHLAVVLEPTGNEQKDYQPNTEEVLVTAEEFSLNTGDYLGFTLSSDKSGNPKVNYARPIKNQFNQPAKLLPISVN